MEIEPERVSILDVATSEEPRVLIAPGSESPEPPKPLPVPEEGCAVEEAIGDSVCEQPDKLPASSLAAVEAKLASVVERIDALGDEFKSKVKYDAVKEKQLEALHSELQEHRQDLYFKLMRPLFLDLIAMHDDVNNLLRHDQDPMNATDGEKRLRRSFGSFAETIEGILDRYGVLTYSEESDHFSAQRQRALRSVETENAEQDRRIAERLRKGFAYGEKVLRPELVATYRLNRATGSGNP